MNRRLALVCAVSGGLVVLQQQWLLRRPPRLLELVPDTIHSGTAAVEVRFSRPMHRRNVASESQLDPDLTHRWHASGQALGLVIENEQPLKTPVLISLAGRDLRMQSMTPQNRWWDPRPWLVVNRSVEGGDQLQLLQRDGTWRPITPIWPAITQMEPLGDGRGIAVVSSDDSGRERIWLQHLKRRGIQPQRHLLDAPTRGSLQPLIEGKLLFGHLSSNLNGDLLVQSGGLKPGSEAVELIQNDGQRRPLSIKSSGPLQLLPVGGGVVVPTFDGLRLQPLINGTPESSQMLPGSRELGAFCHASGRAVLIRHWPDYRRSIELVMPGLPPRQLHLGDQAVLAVACNNTGTTIWAVLGRWTSQGRQQTIVLMNEMGQIQRQQQLNPWLLQPGTRLLLDPVGQQLLMSVNQSPNKLTGRTALMDSTTLEWREIGETAIKEAVWLSP